VDRGPAVVVPEGSAVGTDSEAQRESLKADSFPYYYWTLAGTIFILWLGWGVVAWLVSGPHQITGYRTHANSAAEMALLSEAAAIALALVVSVLLIRQCRRQKRLTFEAQFCIAASFLLLLDPGINFVQPLFFYSSTFVNLNSWLGHVPFVVNPAANSIPIPIITQPMFYSFGFLVIVMFINWTQQIWLRLSPEATGYQLFVVAVVVGWGCDFISTYPQYLSHLYDFPGTPNIKVLGVEINRLGGNPAYSMLTEGLVLGIAFAVFATIRRQRDALGKTIFERNLDRVTPRWRKMVSILSLTGVLMTTLFAAELVQISAGLHSAPYQRVPTYLVNGACDAPGITGTSYGPCPGSQDYRMPIRGQSR